MLNLDGLKGDIQAAFNETLPSAFEQALRDLMPQESTDGNERAKKFGETVDKLVSEPLAARIASAIDYYIKSGSIYGTIITVGSPFTQTAVISPINLGNPTAGAVPNTLGIQ
jgi:hypothetical protein